MTGPVTEPTRDATQWGTENYSPDPAAVAAALLARRLVASGPDGMEERVALADRMDDVGRKRDPALWMWAHLWRIDVAFGIAETDGAVRTGTVDAVNAQLMDNTKPEAACFGTEDGRRTGYLVIDMVDSAQNPVIAEPFFQRKGATVQSIPVMNADDLEHGSPRRPAAEGTARRRTAEPPRPLSWGFAVSEGRHAAYAHGFGFHDTAWLIDVREAPWIGKAEAGHSRASVWTAMRRERRATSC